MRRAPYMTAGELVGRLGVAMTHLYWLTRSGKIPFGEKLGRERVYSRAEADANVDRYGHYRTAREGMTRK